MEFGRVDDSELPAEAKGEDLITLASRLRAAMVRAGRTPVINKAGKRIYYAELKAMLEAAGHEINKQTVHNWFRPSCQFIEPLWLFRVAKVLNAAPEWLATGEGRLTPPTVLSDDHQQAIEMWDSMPTEKARGSWIRMGHEILDNVGSKSRSAPFPAAHAEIADAKRGK